MKKSKAFIEKYLPSYQDAGRVNKPELPPIDPSKLSREQYEALYNQGRVATYDPASGAYQPPMMEGITITADKPKSAADFFDRYNKKANTSADHLLEAMFTVPIDYITGLPQAAMSYMLDPEKSLTPSEALDITNPVIAFAVDAVTDPADLVGAGLVGDALRIGKGIKKGSKAAKALREVKTTPHEKLDKMTEEFLLPESKNPKVVSTVENFQKRLRSPEGKKRLKQLGITEKEILENVKVKENNNTFGHYNFSTNLIHVHPEDNLMSQTIRHELEHAVQDAVRSSEEKRIKKPLLTLKAMITDPSLKTQDSRLMGISKIDNILENIELRSMPTPNRKWGERKDLATSGLNINDFYPALKRRQLATDYFATGSGGREKSAMLAEVQDYMMDKGIIPKDSYTHVTPKMVEDAFAQAIFDEEQGQYLRLFNISKPTERNFKLISKGLNNMLSISPLAIGTALVTEQNNKRKHGGKISSIQKLGYKRNSPHKNRRSININSNLITMDGVDIPLMLVPDNDEPMVAPPNSGQYMFPNSSSVQEIPMGKYRLGGMPCMECGGTVKYQGGGKIKSFKNKWLNR